MQLTSPVFTDNEHIPEVYTCFGQNVNPSLRIEESPPNAASLALTIIDQDATPQPWIHWFVYNINPRTKEIADNSVPPGATEGYANGGTPGYEGPCPKYFTGTHHYVFTLYALDTVLDIDPTSTFTDAADTIQRHTLETATLTGLADGTEERG